LQIVEGGQLPRFGFSGCGGAARFAERLLDAALGFVQGRGLGQALGKLALMRGERTPGEIGGRSGGALRLALVALGLHRGFDRGTGGREAGARLNGRGKGLGPGGRGEGPAAWVGEAADGR